MIYPTKDPKMSEIHTHKTKPVRIGRKIIQVDEKLSDLVYHLNKCGLKTLSSCQKDSDGNSYLILDYNKIRLVSAVNTPYPVVLIKWRKSNRKLIYGDSTLSNISEVIQETKRGNKV